MKKDATHHAGQQGGSLGRYTEHHSTIFLLRWSDVPIQYQQAQAMAECTLLLSDGVQHGAEQTLSFDTVAVSNLFPKGLHAHKRTLWP